MLSLSGRAAGAMLLQIAEGHGQSILFHTAGQMLRQRPAIEAVQPSSLNRRRVFASAGCKKRLPAFGGWPSTRKVSAKPGWSRSSLNFPAVALACEAVTGMPPRRSRWHLPAGASAAAISG
jgi:hypothetical protein